MNIIAEDSNYIQTSSPVSIKPNAINEQYIEEKINYENDILKYR